MPNCHWVIDEESGDHALYCDDELKVTIPEGRNIKADEGKPGASTITLDELKADMEMEFCGRLLE